MQDEILDMLMKKDEITWRDLINDLVKSERMDPWDVDLSLLTKKYVDIVKQLKEVNFFVSGKVVLAAAILLKMKTNKLLSHNIANFDSQLFASDEEEEFEQAYEAHQLEEGPRVKLTIKTPQARKRRVQLNDLIGALEKALEVDEKRAIRRARFDRVPEAIKLPERTINLGDRIKTVYDKINLWFVKNNSDMVFTDLLDEGSKVDKVLTFIPLLHLENQNKVNMKQPEAFGNIYIRLFSENKNNERNQKN